MNLREQWFFKRGVENSLLLYILLFLACLNFEGRGPVFFFIYSIYGIIVSKNVEWDNSLIPYIALFVGAFIPSVIFYDINDIIKSFTYYLCFFAAYRAYYAAENKESYLFRTVWTAVLGLFSHLLLLYFSNFMILEHIEGERMLIDFWTGDFIQVTIVGLVSSVPIAFSFYCLFLSRNVVSVVLGALFLGVAFLINVDTATRTPFVIFAIVYAVLFWEVFRSSEGRKKVHMVLFFVVLFVLLAFKFLPYLETTAIGQRYEEDGMETSRLQLMGDYFNLMVEYPFGGGFGEKTIQKQAHNFIQEGYDMFGILFFLALILIVFQIIVREIKLHTIINKNKCTYLIFILYLVILLQSLTEPVIQGYPQLLWLLFVVDGFAVPYIRDNYEIIQEEAQEETQEDV